MHTLNRGGTPQGGVISPLLWVLVVNEILEELKLSGARITAYADDVVIIVRGKFLPTISDLLEKSLRTLVNWARKCGLGVNPQKTELVLFTRRRSIPQFKLPAIDGTFLKLSDKAKYLGIVLDRRLNWKANVCERVKKATCAMYTCNKIIGKKWGPNPKTILWLYTAVVRPILTYGCAVWWQAAQKTTNLKLMTKVQRLACLATTGAMRTTPTAGLEVILHLLPLDLFMQESAAKCALRLNQSGNWKPNSTGHASILHLIKPQEGQSDYMLPFLDFDKPFRCHFPTRDEWESNEPINDPSIKVYTDGSKMKMEQVRAYSPMH